MSRAHWSLLPSTNILLTLAWGVVAAVLISIVEPHPFALIAVAAVLGSVGGLMQHLSIAQAPENITKGSSLIEVRRAVKATKWGSRYILWLYASRILLIGLAFILVRHPLFNVVLGYLAGDLTFMFVREVVTLRDSFRLSRIFADDGPTKSKTA